MIGNLDSERVDKARELLNSDPDNAEAHLALGRWLCLYKRQWEKGLPHLLRGSNEQLNAAAKSEIDRPPTDSSERMEAGDRWWDLVEKVNLIERRALYQRTAHWYRLSVTDTRSSIERLKMKRRLQTIEEATDP
jgi:hypothetical protein